MSVQYIKSQTVIIIHDDDTMTVTNSDNMSPKQRSVLYSRICDFPCGGRTSGSMLMLDDEDFKVFDMRSTDRELYNTVKWPENPILIFHIK